MKKYKVITNNLRWRGIFKDYIIIIPTTTSRNCSVRDFEDEEVELLSTETMHALLTIHPDWLEAVKEKKGAKIIKMKGSKEEGKYIYEVNKDGTVNPWSNPMLSIKEALNNNYTIYEIQNERGDIFKIKDEVKYKNAINSPCYEIADFYLREDGIILARSLHQAFVEDVDTIIKIVKKFTKEDMIEYAEHYLTTRYHLTHKIGEGAEEIFNKWLKSKENY